MNNKNKFVILLSMTAILLTACNAQVQESAEPAPTQSGNNRFADYDFANVPETIQLNENPDLSEKVLPTPYEFADYSIPYDVSDIIIPESKLIIAAAVETSDHYYSMTGSIELDSAINDKIGTFGVSKGFNTMVEVLYSPNNEFDVGDKIQIFSPGKNWGENLEIGKEYMLVIHHWDDIYYQYTDGMNSIFEIDDDFNVTSRSPYIGPSQLDTLPLAQAVSVLDDAIDTE